MRERLLFGDYMRVLACLAVVVLHSSGELVFGKMPSEMPQNGWWAGHLFNTLTRWSVPVFIMLSGYLLLGKTPENQSIQVAFSRFKRIFKVYVFWSVLFLLYQYGNRLTPQIFPEIARKFLIGESYYHLWYLSMLMGLYLLTPFIDVILLHGTRQLLTYFVLFWVCINTTHWLHSDFLVTRYIGWMGFIGYYLTGYYIRLYPPSPHVNKYIYVLGFLGLLVTYVATYYLSHTKGQFAAEYYDFLSPNVMATSVALFIYLRQFPYQQLPARLTNIVSEVAAAGLGIYLVHTFWLDVLKNGYLGGIVIYHYQLVGIPVSPFLAAPVVSLCVFGLSYVSVRVLWRIRWFRPFIS
jgi:surface polysaccharide O-acyltransferase-like enzyme